MQSKFYEKFIDLEDEVRHRDDVIQQLQNRIHDLETGTVTVYGGGRGGGVIKDGEGGGKDRPGSSGSTGSSNELPFMVSTSNFLSTFYCDSCICNLFFCLSTLGILLARFIGLLIDCTVEGLFTLWFTLIYEMNFH